jgi:hypothetical protein
MNAPLLLDATTGEVVSAVSWDSVALHIPEGTTFPEWSELGRTLQQMEKSVMWWIGDWLRFGERKYGETYAQAIEATGYSNQTLRDAKWVAEAYSDLSLRKDNLSFTHHKEAASLPPAEREGVLTRAASGAFCARGLAPGRGSGTAFLPGRESVAMRMASVLAAGSAGVICGARSASGLLSASSGILSAVTSAETVCAGAGPGAGPRRRSPSRPRPGRRARTSRQAARSS